MDDRLVAFDPPGVYIMTGSRDNKYDINVGRNDLVCAGKMWPTIDKQCNLLIGNSSRIGKGPLFFRLLMR
jgi:hypothetical protein